MHLTDGVGPLSPRAAIPKIRYPQGPLSPSPLSPKGNSLLVG